MKCYLANSLFSQADFLYNHFIAEQLRTKFPEIDLYVPQENEAINDKSGYASSVMISSGDDKYLLESDFLICIIDGNTIDEGVACEIGKFAGFDLAYAQYGHDPRPIFALYTDSRQNGRDNQKKIDALVKDGAENQFMYRNLYVVGTIKDSRGGIYSNVDDMMDAIEKYWEVEKNARI